MSINLRTMRSVPVRGHYRKINGKQVWVNEHKRTIFGKPHINTKRGLYSHAKHPKYAKIVQIDTPSNALWSIHHLQREFYAAKTEEKKLRICRVTQYTANRVEAMEKKKNLSPHERQELQKIATIYDNSAELMFSRL